MRAIHQFVTNLGLFYLHDLQGYIQYKVLTIFSHSQVLEFFKVLLPKLKTLCKEGCMLPIIDIIHSCLKPDTLTEIGLSRVQMEDIFDLACIQQRELRDHEKLAM